MRCLLLLGLCGCELYFTDPPNVAPDAATKPTPVDAGIACPSDPSPIPPGLSGFITSPAEGATVSDPVEVLWHWSDPNQDARKFTVLVDQNGNQSATLYPCATVPTGDDQASCYTNLAPNTKYTFHMYWICWGGSTPYIPINERTFATAP